MLLRCWTALLVGLWSASALATITPRQAVCVAEMNRVGLGVFAAQGQANHQCVVAGGEGDLEQLGGPGQEQTAQACLQNDVGGGVAQSVAGLESVDEALCSPYGRPPFGYLRASDTSEEARSEAIGIVADLFGPDLDASLASAAVSPGGATCQRQALLSANELLIALGVAGLPGIPSALLGAGRQTGSDPSAPAETSLEVADEVTSRVLDGPPTVAATVASLHTQVQAACSPVAPDLSGLFPGLCPGAGGAAALAECVEDVARRRYYSMVEGLLNAPIACDLLDNGRFDQSCAETRLVEHVLNRVTYGPNAWTRARVDTLGLRGFLEEQLDFETIDDTAIEAVVAERYPSIGMSLSEIREAYPAAAVTPGKSDVPVELRNAKLLRAIGSKRQLQEVLADFWFNHFSVNGSAGYPEWFTTPYYRMIRDGLLGRFADLTVGVARSPAMLDYLDNAENKWGRLNENYGRELLELHTLGVNGGYTEADVVDTARVFTGWGIDYNQPDGFLYDHVWHVPGQKTVVGLFFPAGGDYQEGVDLIEHLTAQRATAEFVSGKLVSYLVDERRPTRLVQHAADVWQSTNGDLRAVAEAIVFSRELLLFGMHRQAKVKRPHRLAASIARAVDADPALLNVNALQIMSRDMGENLFGAGPPTGYPDNSEFWKGPGTMLTRFNQIEYWANGNDQFVFDLGIQDGSATEIVDQLIARIFPARLSDATRLSAIVLVQGLSDFSFHHRHRQALAFLLSSPEFLIH